MSPNADGLLPRVVADELLRRWREPHRRYHGVSHLINGLYVLETLGGTRLERIAFWFHDAVHSNNTPADENASAAQVADLLAGHALPGDIAEVQRLVLLTAGHRTEPNDLSGQRVCDADLSALGADPATYCRNVEGIRAEMPALTEAEWQVGRSRFLTQFLERERFFATATGRRLWEAQARVNMENELADLASKARREQPRP